MAVKNIIALGAEGKANFSVISEKGLYTSEPAGDISVLEAFNKFENAVRKCMRENKFTADYIACDLHPDYHSTALARDICLENKNSKLVYVQHHFAHVVACMLDNDIDEEVLGVSFDGTGLGLDGASWGGEFLLCTRRDFRRIYHLKYIAQPGADTAAKEVWRMALAYLIDAYGDDFDKINHPILKRIRKNKINIIKQMIDKTINCPLTSSMGRLFDAVSSLIGVCDVSNFEGTAAIALEKQASLNIDGYYNYDIVDGKITVSKMIIEIVDDLNRGADKGSLSAKFHNTIGEIIFDISTRITKEYGIDKVLLTGGVFQNKYLLDYIDRRFQGCGLKVFKHNKYPTTDLGVSIGQAVVAANL